jgi:hypothetical protein
MVIGLKGSAPKGNIGALTICKSIICAGQEKGKVTTKAAGKCVLKNNCLFWGKDLMLTANFWFARKQLHQFP